MKKILEVKNFAKRYEGKQVHQDVNFFLLEGETLGLLGHSGTGKSVLLRSIIGLEELDQGEIIYRGQALHELSENGLFTVRTKISYSFQSGALFDSMSVFENIAYPLFEHTNLREWEVGEKVEQLLNLVNLENTGDLMPSDLSGGMQKRVGLARSMALQPDIMLYDEPTAGLDPVNVEMVLEVMKKFKDQGMSGIFVTHDIPAAKKICDRVLILKNGKIGFEGTVEQFEASQDPFVKTFFIGAQKS